MIRHSEDIGLVAPRRAPNGLSAFQPRGCPPAEVPEPSAGLDFSLQDCRDLLMLKQDTGRSSAEVHEIATRHLAQVDGRLADLSRLRDALQRFIQSYPGTGSRIVPFLMR